MGATRYISGYPPRPPYSGAAIESNPKTENRKQKTTMSATDDINEGGRTSSSNNGVDDNNSSPAVRITLQVDNTSALPLFLQGRVRYLCEKKENRRKKGRANQ